MKTLTVALLLIASSASAQLLSPGAAQYPSPALGRHFLDASVAQCVIAKPCPYGDCVILQPCPPGTLVPPPPASQLPAPAPPPVVSAPIAPTPEPKEPAVLRIEVVPVAPVTPAPKPAPKAAPKKGCPC